MPIEIQCQKCSQKLRAPDNLAGKRVKCPKCAAAILVEGPAGGSAEKVEAVKKDSKQPVKAKPLETPKQAEWYMQTEDGESYGPISKSELDEWVGDGRIDSTCQVLQEGWDQWKWAEEVFPELAESAKAAGEAGEKNPFAGIAASAGTSESVNPYAAPEAVSDQEAGEAAAGAITAATRRALAETRPWVLFISILMFIGVGFMLLGAVFVLIGSLIGGMGFLGVISLVYVLFAAVYVVPAYYLFKYGQRIGDFLRQNGDRQLEAAIVAQKSFWKFVGILTAVCLGLYVVMIVVVLMAGTLGSM